MVHDSLYKILPDFHGSAIASPSPALLAGIHFSGGCLGSQLTNDFIICSSQGSRLDLMNIEQNYYHSALRCHQQIPTCSWSGTEAEV